MVLICTTRWAEQFISRMDTHMEREVHDDGAHIPEERHSCAMIGARATSGASSIAAAADIQHQRARIDEP